MTEAELANGAEGAMFNGIAALEAGPTAVLHWPGAQDFSGYLSAKRKGFVGREWLFVRVIAWTTSGTNRSVLVIGAPWFWQVGHCCGNGRAA